MDLPKLQQCFFIFRDLSGIGGGGVNCLVMITFSELLSPRQRGKYFGIVAAATSAGNGIGPFIGGLLAEHASWRWALSLSSFSYPLLARAVFLEL